MNAGVAGEGAFAASVACSLLFFAISTAASWARWANFEYRTFDLAYYVQAIWQLLHGRFFTSIVEVPLLGNHVEPIIFLFVPFFAVLQHPIVFVALQNAALAAMCPVGYGIARELRFTRRQALMLGAALLVAPTTGFVALHEFHPEALSALFLLLVIRARLRGSIAGHWAWFCAVLACKENMAFLLVAYCLVGLVAERQRGFGFLRSFYLWPLLAAGSWFLLCVRVITPSLNAGSIDYLGLYQGLGTSGGDILRNAVVDPSRMIATLSASLHQGNLIPGTLLPFLLLPLLRPRWLFVAAPVILQHLLSWRASEWGIYFHYAAPLIPIFWIAAVEAIVHLRAWKTLAALASSAPWLLIGACGTAQWMLGPAAQIARTATEWSSLRGERARKNAFVAKIPDAASVVAPLPYLSHLAARRHCYSLHFVLKGLKTLSHDRYRTPEPPEFVLIDYADTATFDAAAGYYHPAMQTTSAGVVESSDELLHEFLSSLTWTADAADELVLLARTEQPTAGLSNTPPEPATVTMGNGTTLLAMRRSSDRIAPGEPISVVMDWALEPAREKFPWLDLMFVNDASGERTLVTKGLCAPQIRGGFSRETWQIARAEQLASGTYHVEARFYDNPARAWFRVRGSGGGSNPLLCPPIALGPLTVVDEPRRQ